jgi:hypothetical protein
MGFVMKDYSRVLDYYLELMHEVHGKPTSAEEFAVRLKQAWPKLQEPQCQWALQRIMEIFSNAKARRERLQHRFGL